MKKLLILVAVFALTILPSLAMAADSTTIPPGNTSSPDNVTMPSGASRNASIGSGLAVLGGGVAVIGAGLGIGRIGGSAMEGIARQPAEGARIAANMIIAAALVEGAALFAIALVFLKA